VIRESRALEQRYTATEGSITADIGEPAPKQAIGQRAK